MPNIPSIATQIATQTGASAEIVAAILERELATMTADINRRERRARVAMELLRELSATPDLSAYPTERSVLPGFRALWRAQQLVKAERND
jgi:hypothetical protein